MFVCNECFKEREMEKDFAVVMSPKSYGPCEMCDGGGECADWHGKLKPITKPRDEKAKPKE